MSERLIPSPPAPAPVPAPSAGRAAHVPTARPARRARGALAAVLGCMAMVSLAACTEPAPQAPVTSSASATASTPAADKDTATGELIEGFPTEVIGPLSGSTIITSSRTPAAERTVYSVNATTTSTLAAVQQHYQNLLLTQGYAMLPPSSATNLSTFTYAKQGSSDIVTITVTAAGAASDGVAYTAVATLRDATTS